MFSWSWGHAIGSGEPWLGALPTTKGRVLIIEVDQPISTLQQRVAKLEKRGPDVWFLGGPPMNVPNIDPETANALAEAKRVAQPDVVIFNTLRNLTTLELESGTTCRIVYGWAREQFPNTSLVFVHHPKKEPPSNVHVNEDEMFSGSNAWRNDAQVSLHLKAKKEKRHGRIYSTALLRHTGAQVSAVYSDLPLKLDRDGSTWSCPLAEELVAIRKLAFDSDLSGNALDKLVVMNHIVGSVSTARKRRLKLEAGFPGVEWLGRKHEEEPEGEEDDDGN